MNWRLLGIPLIGEGVTVLLCLIPALHFDDGTVVGILLSSVITLVAGVLFLTLFPRLSHGNGGSDKWGSYVTVALMWVLQFIKLWSKGGEKNFRVQINR